MLAVQHQTAIVTFQNNPPNNLHAQQCIDGTTFARFGIAGTRRDTLTPVRKLAIVAVHNFPEWLCVIRKRNLWRGRRRIIIIIIIDLVPIVPVYDAWNAVIP